MKFSLFFFSAILAVSNADVAFYEEVCDWFRKCFSLLLPMYASRTHTLVCSCLVAVRRTPAHANNVSLVTIVWDVLVDAFRWFVALLWNALAANAQVGTLRLSELNESISRDS